MGQEAIRDWDHMTRGEALDLALRRARKFLDADRPLDAAAMLEADLSKHTMTCDLAHEPFRRIIVVPPPERTRVILCWIEGLG
jgi:hypothetical protein